jgi:hypothetical protein
MRLARVKSPASVPAPSKNSSTGSAKADEAVRVALSVSRLAVKQTSALLATPVLEYHPLSVTSRTAVLGVEPNPSPAAALAAGTNAEPKRPASKPAVVTAVTSLFLMN